jgi:hypothetical protein
MFVAAVLPDSGESEAVYFADSTPSLPQALRQALPSIAFVCGWVVLFRVLLRLLVRWLPVGGNPVTNSILTGVLELTNGCIGLRDLPCIGVRFVFCSAFLAFGGICVLLQTVSVTGELGLGSYLPGKLLQMVASVFLSGLTEYFVITPSERIPFLGIITLLSGAILVIAVFFLKKRGNASSISRESGV